MCPILEDLIQCWLVEIGKSSMNSNFSSASGILAKKLYKLLYLYDKIYFLSGGGTVYHDLGNMNCTFFTRKSAYDRRRNLDIVCKAIQSMSQAINVRINDRDDIVVNSGSDPENDKKVK